MYRYTTESSHTFGPSHFIGPATFASSHCIRGEPAATRVAVNARRARAHESAPPSPSTRALNARRRRRHCRPRRRPLARARARSARAPLASPSVACSSRARVGSHHPTLVLQSNARKFKPQVHRRRSIEAPFKIFFIGCRTSLPHREGILLGEN